MSAELYCISNGYAGIHLQEVTMLEELRYLLSRAVIGRVEGTG